MAPITEDISGPGAGEYTTGAANVPTTPTYVGHIANQISFTFSENSNGSAVGYAVWFEEYDSALAIVDSGYLNSATGDDNGASESWATYATWGTVVTAINLLDQYGYKFKVKARNEADVETAFSSLSAMMTSLINLSVSPQSNTVTYECTTGDCKISGLTVIAIGDASPGQFTIAYTLTRLHNVSTKNNVRIYYSTNGTDYTEIADAAITGAPGTRQTLTASAVGTANSNIWLSCVTAGNSYYGTVYIKVVPYDTATAGDVGDAAITTCAVDNLPKAVTISEISSFTWDADTTPEIVADMPRIMCGSFMYFIVHVYDSTGAEIQTNSSAESIAGFYYEQAHATLPGSSTRNPESGWDTNWTAVTTFGVAAAYLPPTYTGNRIRYIFQTVLSQGNTYSVKMQAAEIRSVLI